MRELSAKDGERGALMASETNFKLRWRSFCGILGSGSAIPVVFEWRDWGSCSFVICSGKGVNWVNVVAVFVFQHGGWCTKKRGGGGTMDSARIEFRAATERDILMDGFGEVFFPERVWLRKYVDHIVVV